jgi:hypothetical protein
MKSQRNSQIVMQPCNATLTKNYKNMYGLGGGGQNIREWVFQLRHCHRSWVPRSSAVAFQFGSNDPFFKIANKKLAWLSSDILLNLPKFSRDL